MSNKLKSRKFWAFVIAHILSDVLLSVSVLPASEWVQFNGILFGAYFAANVGEKFSPEERIKAKKEN